MHASEMKKKCKYKIYYFLCLFPSNVNSPMSTDNNEIMKIIKQKNAV